MKKLGYILFIIFFLLSTFIFLLVGRENRAEATYRHGPYPTSTPTSTPTNTPTPFPTIDPCHVEQFTEKDFYEFEPCITPTPEATPSPKVNAGSDGRSDGKSDGRGGWAPPQCTGTIPNAPIATGGERVDPDTVVVRWHRSTDLVNHYVLVYGTSPDNLEWGVPNIPSHMDHYELHGVPQGHIWFRVTAEADNYCVAHSNVIDP